MSAAQQIDAGWVPIETAPKNGEWILLAGPTSATSAGQLVCCWNGRDWQSGDDGYGAYINPTHWMPLPRGPGAAPAAPALDTPAQETAEQAFERGRQQGREQERALWELAKVDQEIDAQCDGCLRGLPVVSGGMHRADGEWPFACTALEHRRRESAEAMRLAVLDLVERQREIECPPDPEIVVRAMAQPEARSDGAPTEIWLQLHGDDEPDGRPVDYTDSVSWCWHQIHQHDVRYVLAESAPAERESLSFDRIEEIWVEHGLDECDPQGFARAIERAHGIQGKP